MKEYKMNIDKLVQYAELKAGQFGVDYRENHEEDEVAEVAPKTITARGTSVILDYDAKSYEIDLTQSGLTGEVTAEDAQAVADRMTEFYRFS
ncbi:hypothetical protein ERX27_11020 [Macrococcus brunensis]|uniref:Uncharacterized protein n=1 Tax=Macrococcus brunensis TaxID=198483 RepID=A0A4R6BAJ2_9STAP|nr:hypothetical protein [Macrococcus brunensis]TDL93318.1 hypothetical protein ERX27_11020 [Macrococcus brunensis]ULG73729.1 hypothetical protein MGG13_08485 [Macrococcus brunensis]